MSMVKRGLSNINPKVNKVVDTFRIGDAVCENDKCGSKLDISTSKNGIITCLECGHKNKVQDMENIHE